MNFSVILLFNIIKFSFKIKFFKENFFLRIYYESVEMNKIVIFGYGNFI